MSIYSINIKNFRGIKDLEIEDFKNINLFVGKNNCGKTSILEAIFLSIGVSNPQLSIKIDSFRGITHDKNDDFHFIFYNLNSTNTIDIKTQFLYPNQYRQLLIKPIYLTSKKNVDFSEVIDTDTSSVSTSDRRISGINLIFSVKSLPKSKDKFLQSSIEFKPGGLDIKAPNEYHEKHFGVFLNSRNITTELHTRLDKIIQKKEINKFINTLNIIDPRITGISLGSRNMIYFDLGLDRLIPIQLMGDGIIRLLSILAAIANIENGVLLIDEIENGFHTSTLNLLWSSVKEVALAYNVQIFATTHSFECVKTYTESMQPDLLGNEISRLFRIENEKNKLHRAIKYDSESLEASLESGWEIR